MATKKVARNSKHGVVVLPEEMVTGRLDEHLSLTWLHEDNDELLKTRDDGGNNETWVSSLRRQGEQYISQDWVNSFNLT